VLIVVVALTLSSVMVDGLRFPWFPHGYAGRSVAHAHDVDTAAKQDSSAGSHAASLQPVFLRADLLCSAPGLSAEAEAVLGQVVFGGGSRCLIKPVRGCSIFPA